MFLVRRDNYWAGYAALRLIFVDVIQLLKHGLTLRRQFVNLCKRLHFELLCERWRHIYFPTMKSFRFFGDLEGAKKRRIHFCAIEMHLTHLGFIPRC